MILPYNKYSIAGKSTKVLSAKTESKHPSICQNKPHQCYIIVLVDQHAGKQHFSDMAGSGGAHFNAL